MQSKLIWHIYQCNRNIVIEFELNYKFQTPGHKRLFPRFSPQFSQNLTFSRQRFVIKANTASTNFFGRPYVCSPVRNDNTIKFKKSQSFIWTYNIDYLIPFTYKDCVQYQFLTLYSPVPGRGQWGRHQRPRERPLHLRQPGRFSRVSRHSSSNILFVSVGWSVNNKYKPAYNNPNYFL